MLQILRAHALANVWCEPIQDKQFVIGPRRLTKVGGALKTALVLWENIPLPTNDKTAYHVYHVGQLDPSIFNFDLPFQEWVNAATLMQDNNLVIDVYLNNGCKIPKSFIFLRKNNDKNLVLAIKHRYDIDYGTHTLDNNPINLRFYSNARYDSNEWLSQPDILNRGIKVLDVKVTKQEDYSLFMGECQLIDDMFIQGVGLFFEDGFLIDKPIGWTPSRIGKTYSFYWDQSAKEFSFYKLPTLPTFMSTLDNGYEKYLLLRETDYGMIDYHDDIDIYVMQKIGDTYKGVMLPRKHINVVRMLTHNAYALRKDLISNLISLHSFLSNTDNVWIGLFVREGGMKRGLTHQHVRVEELYKLGYMQRLVAMVMQNDVVEWRAANLENSFYSRLMSDDISTITNNEIDSAYGYNAAMRVAAEPLQTVTVSPNLTYANTPPLLQELDKNDMMTKQTTYAYNNQGVLLGWLNTHYSYNYIPLPNTLTNVSFVETFNYQTSETRDGCFYETDITSHALKQYGFRAYACPIVGGIPSEVWYDITDTAYYDYNPNGTLANNFTPTLVWNKHLEDMANLHTCVKIDNVMNIFTAPPLTPNFLGYIKFTVQTEVDWLGNGVYITRPQKIPPAAIDVFMDGKSLIEDLDYYVKWPEIVIVKRPSTLPQNTVIQVRTYGLCKPTSPLTHYKPREQGFVKGGILSINERYNIRNDRCIRVIVADELRPRNTVRFAETTPGPLSTDGRPYAIYDYPLSCTNFTAQQTIPFRETSMVLDDKVSDYLTGKVLEDTIQYPRIIDAKWSVVSPFCSAIIHAFGTGFLNAGELNVAYTDSEIDIWVQPYKHLLDFDPCVLENDVPMNVCDNKRYHEYVIIYPHPYLEFMTVSQKQYAFLERIIALYLNNRTDLTPSVNIGI